MEIFTEEETLVFDFAHTLSVISDDAFRFVLSFDGDFYICKTCRKILSKNCIPCQVVCNMLEVYELPKEFRDAGRLVREHTNARLIFKKISIMAKGPSPKLKRSLLYFL